MTDAFVLGGVRTPVGRYGGSLSHIRVDDLLGQTMAWACERVGVPLDRIEEHRRRVPQPGPRGDGGYRPLGGAGGGVMYLAWGRKPTAS
jgi:acetyl-CoA acetyltransferase